MNRDIYIDAESIGIDMMQIVSLMNIVIDDFVDNGEDAARRELTVSALFVIKNNLDLLADKQMGIAARMREDGKS